MSKVVSELVVCQCAMVSALEMVSGDGGSVTVLVAVYQNASDSVRLSCQGGGGSGDVSALMTVSVMSRW